MVSYFVISEIMVFFLDNTNDLLNPALRRTIFTLGYILEDSIYIYIVLNIIADTATEVRKLSAGHLKSSHHNRIIYSVIYHFRGIELIS